MSFPATSDVCLNIFASCWPRLFDFPQGAHVLEVGCAEANWIDPMKAARPDLHITGIDVRTCQREKADALIVGDVLTHDFPPSRFDAVVFISSLEHIGLGAYGDPLDEDGDTKAIQRAWTWLKPGGLLYADVPYGRFEVKKGKWRVYDQRAVERRLVPDATAAVTQHLAHPDHPDAPYLALMYRKAA